MKKWTAAALAALTALTALTLTGQADRFASFSQGS